MRLLIFSVNTIFLRFILGLSVLVASDISFCQNSIDFGKEFIPENILAKMNLVNDYFLSNSWMNNDRNWIRGTYYTGLMAFYHVSEDSSLLLQAERWAAKHGWRTGTEWTYPANRLTCTQAYLELYFIDKNENKIENTRSFMDKRINDHKQAAEQGYDYVDALYVGIPAYVMMARVTSNPEYSNYGNRIFWEVVNDLYNPDVHLIYRDEKAKQENEFWSRGNGWALASIPRILNYLPENDPAYIKYIELLEQMAKSISELQGEDGFWRTDLTNPNKFPNPESSGTAFFTYAFAWGINKGILDKEEYLPIIKKSWKALYHAVDSTGKVCWGQGVSRDPGNVDKEDSEEYVLGAFLLAGSEILKLVD